MLYDFGSVALGLVLLLAGGDLLVRGAVSLALKLGIPALIVSLTVVAFGTSAPELLITVQSVIDGAPGLALGNVVGSNVANVLLVLGLPAILMAIHPGDGDSRRTFLMMIGTSAIAMLLCFMGPLDIWHGAVLLSLFVALIWDAIRTASSGRGARKLPEAASLAELEHADPHLPPFKIAALIIGGLILLPVGANLLVDGAVRIAASFGVSDAIIGLTIVAIGTSLPELATSVSAALRRQTDVAIGNVIGSNMFNILAILGIASLFGPLDVPEHFLTVDLWVMLGSSLLLYPFVFLGWCISRGWGIALISLYGLYILTLVV